MRILFVAGTLNGGSAKTTHELARRLIGRGHEVKALMRVEDRSIRNYLYKRQVNLTTKLNGRAFQPALLFIQRQMGRWARRSREDLGYPVSLSTFLENAFPSVQGRFHPNVVVASSLDRIAWRRIRAFCRNRGIPTVLYMRGVSCLGHLQVSKAPPDLLLSNTRSVSDMAAALGYDCPTVPSLVETGRCRVESTREVVLLVNPIPLLGVETAWKIAASRPDIPFVFQESWPLEAGSFAELQKRAWAAGNVQVRRRVPDAREIYRDARILLAPHTVDNRPRVVLEAQSNGIPVLASAYPGLAEAVGDGGILVESDAPLGRWLEVLGRLWGEPESYRELSERALRHSRRREVQSEGITQLFDEHLQLVVGTPRNVAVDSASRLAWLNA